MNLEKLNVTELNYQEIRNTTGGNFLIAIAIGLAWSAWENIGDIREGFSDGIKGKKPRY